MSYLIDSIKSEFTSNLSSKEVNKQAYLRAIKATFKKINFKMHPSVGGISLEAIITQFKEIDKELNQSLKQDGYNLTGIDENILKDKKIVNLAADNLNVKGLIKYSNDLFNTNLFNKRNASTASITSCIKSLRNIKGILDNKSLFRRNGEDKKDFLAFKEDKLIYLSDYGMKISKIDAYINERDDIKANTLLDDIVLDYKTKNPNVVDDYKDSYIKAKEIEGIKPKSKEVFVDSEAKKMNLSEEINDSIHQEIELEEETEEIILEKEADKL